MMSSNMHHDLPKYLFQCPSELSWCAVCQVFSHLFVLFCTSIIYTMESSQCFGLSIDLLCPNPNCIWRFYFTFEKVVVGPNLHSEGGLFKVIQYHCPQYMCIQDIMRWPKYFPSCWHSVDDSSWV